jgi:hypothetical protein
LHLSEKLAFHKKSSFVIYVSRKDAKAQSATAFLKNFFAPWRLYGRRSPPLMYFLCKGGKVHSIAGIGAFMDYV